MVTPELAKPLLHALQTKQAHLAMRSGPLIRFRPEIAPFAVVVEPGVCCNTEDLALREAIYVVDETPEIPQTWTQSTPSRFGRFLYEGKVEPPVRLEGETELDARNAEEMMELTKVASPGFFRPEIVRAGRYIGLRLGGELVAMAGERLQTTNYSEVSGVCTRPEHTGRGYARHLMLRIMHGQQARGLTPFLHVDEGNSRARMLYEHMGFKLVQHVTVTRLERTG
jgi:GNAT superfamily N-acetyltransferase